MSAREDPFHFQRTPVPQVWSVNRDPLQNWRAKEDGEVARLLREMGSEGGSKEEEKVTLQCQDGRRRYLVTKEAEHNIADLSRCTRYTSSRGILLYLAL